MTDRLSPGDTAFLYTQDAATPMHVGGVVILRGDPEVDYDRIVAHIAERLSQVPRYRQKVRVVPGRLALPVWVDDEDFDLTYHVRRSALPKPGNDSQLDDLVGRLISRPLDTERPLWEMYVVEGLSDGRVAIINKTHEAMVDRLGAVDLAAAILDLTPDPDRGRSPTWIPQPAPSNVDLVVDAVSDLTASPGELVDVARLAVVDLRSTLSRVTDLAGGLIGIVRQTFSPAPRSALGVSSTGARRFARYAADLEVFRRIRSAREGTVNDVVLAVLAGALRAWLLSRGEPVTDSTGLRALVPMSVRVNGGSAPVASFLVDLPVAEPSPVMRLHQVAFQTRVHAESGRQVSARSLASLGRYTPPTLHALGARVGSQLSRRSYNVLVTNVPGPQTALFVAGAEVQAMYPVAPLVKGHALAVACTSYRGRVYYGLTADREAMPDVEEFAELLAESLAELAHGLPAKKGGHRR
ncbi:WS/DGAT/MGAT family O-acyltransferase [Nakamurella lactea]|uniref:WS/DGAT/MGAT family O-acyltransferase n=1 Tax=Nakamurella lactea TaxID=459515 RepID=UPI0004159E3D|nr:wax ester/triacylglycerol synthase family O-acyltransferase [Nakamurella lactea]